VTPSWLASVLDRDVDSARWERVGEDRGFTGLVGKVTLTYADVAADQPASLIVKLPMAEGENVSWYRAAQQRDPALARRYYERAALEARFYREVDTAAAARLYYAAVDEAHERVVLVLEDLTAGRPGDALHGCSVDEAALVLERMAHVQAHSRVKEFPRWADRLDARQERYDRSVSVFLERFGDRFPAEVRVLSERLRSRLAAVVAPLVERDRALIHADLHLDNVIFDAPPGGRVVILDWQTACIGHPALDFVNFVYSSLSTDDRRAAEVDLLRHFSSVDTDALRRALLSAFAGTVIWLGGADVERLAGREREFFDAALADGRLVSGLLDHDAIGTFGAEAV
jgi:thiamine kinase-like enzyme